MKKKFFALPYLVWMILFTVVPLMLIFVYAEHIRDLHKSVCQMLSAVFLRLISKEILHPRISPEFHAHGMDFIDLTGGMT